MKLKKLNEHHVCLGKIINTHGIKGELKIEPYTHDLSRFSKIKKLYIGEEHDFFTIEKARHDQRFVYLTLKFYNNINDVLIFKNKFIYIDEEERLPLPEEQYYIFDFIGKDVIDDKGNHIGKVINIIENPANEILVVENSSHKEILIPFVRTFIKEIEENIVVSLIEGMME